MRARVIDQGAAHHVRGDGEEVRAVLPLHAALIDQLEVHVVHQDRALQGVLAGARAARTRAPGAAARRRRRPSGAPTAVSSPWLHARRRPVTSGPRDMGRFLPGVYLLGSGDETVSVPIPRFLRVALAPGLSGCPGGHMHARELMGRRGRWLRMGVAAVTACAFGTFGEHIGASVGPAGAPAPAASKAGNGDGGGRLPKGSVWVVNRDQGSLTIFDAATGAVMGQVEGVGLGAHDVCLAERAGKAFVTAETANAVTVVDLRTLAVDTVAVGPLPHHCEPSPDGRTMYMSLASHTPAAGAPQLAAIDTWDHSVTYITTSANAAARSHGPHPSPDGNPNLCRPRRRRRSHRGGRRDRCNRAQRRANRAGRGSDRDTVPRPALGVLARRRHGKAH